MSLKWTKADLLCEVFELEETLEEKEIEMGGMDRKYKKLKGRYNQAKGMIAELQAKLAAKPAPAPKPVAAPKSATTKPARKKAAPKKRVAAKKPVGKGKK